MTNCESLLWASSKSSPLSANGSGRGIPVVHVGDDLPVLVVDDGGEFVQQPDAEAELVRADRNQIRVSEVPDQNVEKLSGLKN